MNNIQEKDWAEDDWHGHTGMDSACDYCIVTGEVDQGASDKPEAGANKEGDTEQE